MAEETARRGYSDPRTGADIVNIIAGEFAVSGEPNLALATTLGSCVAACVFDPVRAIGGMNHFLLPDAPLGAASKSSRYGSVAMERLINRVLSQGGQRHQLRAKVFGGSALGGWSAAIGARNVEFVMSYLAYEGIPTMAWDVGGDQPRLVRFYPATGRSLVRFVGSGAVATLFETERKLRDKVEKEQDGDIELF